MTQMKVSLNCIFLVLLCVSCSGGDPSGKENAQRNTEGPSKLRNEQIDISADQTALLKRIKSNPLKGYKKGAPTSYAVDRIFNQRLTRTRREVSVGDKRFLRIGGWALSDKKRPVDKIYIQVGGSFYELKRTNLPKPGVAKSLGLKNKNIGFEGVIDLLPFQKDLNKRVKIYVVDEHKKLYHPPIAGKTVFLKE